jgi:hypothetical protein
LSVSRIRDDEGQGVAGRAPDHVPLEQHDRIAGALRRVENAIKSRASDERHTGVIDVDEVAGEYRDIPPVQIDAERIDER